MQTYVNLKNKNYKTVLILEPNDILTYWDMKTADYIFRKNKKGELTIIKSRCVIVLKTRGI